MITYHKEYGCWFQLTEDSKHYALMEMTPYKGEGTSDIIAIWDEDNREIVNWIYGASIFDIADLDHNVERYVTAYEKRKREKEKRERVVRYDFTRAGVTAFERDVIDDILDRDICEWFTLTHAGRELRIPDTAMAYEGMETFLQEAIDDWDYEGVE